MKLKYLKRMDKLISKKWNFDKLKDKQIEIIESLVTEKKDTIGLLPTGYGKSMTYLIPPLITKKTVIIISPLISLMEDQKEKLIEKDIPVAALHGNNPNKQKEIFDIIDGKILVAYMSPEYLINGEGTELVETLTEQKQLGFFAVDEAHCVSAWGHDFRSDYLKIGNIKDLFKKFNKKIPILAVTATATPYVVNDMVDFLKLENPKLVRGNFDRPNLHIKIEKCSRVDQELCHPYIDKYMNDDNDDRIIIYTNSRKEAVNLNDELSKKYKKQTLAYHAGMSKKLRNMYQEKFNSGEIKIIISTIAFGMGIDQNVRCVIIFGCPSSIEEYYQQIGRAGRDERSAETILFFQEQKLVIAKSMSHKNYTNPQIRKAKMIGYNMMWNLYKLNSCRRKFVLEYFGQIPKFINCKNCDNCDKLTKDISIKMFKCLVKDKEISDVFKEKYLKKLKELDYLQKSNGKYKPNNHLINYKKLLLANKVTKKNFKSKYRIFI